MIAALEGIIWSVDERTAIIMVGGVGYVAFASATTLEELSHHQGEETFLWTHLAVREDALDLYAFLDKRELEFFRLLVTLPGIGPKSAIGILSQTTPAILESAISGQDPSYLSKMSGLSAKNSEKIVMGLKDKVIAGSSAPIGIHLSSEAEALEALCSLGYSAKDCREALKGIDREIDIADKVREALKVLGKK